MILNQSRENPDLLVRDEVAAILRVSIRTVDRLIADGELPASRVGRSVRVNRSDVLALVPPSAPSSPEVDGSDRSSPR